MEVLQFALLQKLEGQLPEISFKRIYNLLIESLKVKQNAI